jgi:hypothetical protein
VKDRCEEGQEYGWDSFILASSEEKRKYFAAQLQHAIQKQISDPIISKVCVEQLLGLKADEKISWVDHSSILTVPKRVKNASYDDKDFDFKFFLKLAQSCIENDRICVFGDNDNSDNNTGEKYGETLKSVLFLRDAYPEVLIREEPLGYTLFNKYRGTKLHVAEDAVSPAQEWKSSAPELIDLKITDRCYQNCPNCYQNSGSDGKHADLVTIKAAIDYAHSANAFEIVLGGGEPLLHPDIIEIIKYAGRRIPSVSITTRSHDLSWRKDLQEAIKEHVSAIAYTVDTYEEAMETIPILQYALRDVNKSVEVIPQLVYGIVKEKELNKILDYFSGVVSIVGYKTTGRAAAEPPVKYKKPLEYYLDKYNIWRLTVDTAFLEQCPEFIVSSTCCVREGSISQYIDAVAMTVGPSSYSEQTPIVEEDLHFRYKQTLDISSLISGIKSLDTDSLRDEIENETWSDDDDELVCPVLDIFRSY